MAPSLDIHVANDKQRRAAHANCHDVWSTGLPLAAHVARRENAPLHRRARWIVGCLGSRVVAALASHPIEFQLRGQVLPGIAIASVHTLAEFRGRGLARELLAWTEDFESCNGARMSVLFCDIDPRYYERLGYRLCPAHEGWLDVASAAERLAPPDDDWHLDPADVPSYHSLNELYQADLGRQPLCVARSDEYWRHLDERFPDSELLWLVGPDGSRAGYARLTTTGRELLIEEMAVAKARQPARQRLLALVIRLAADRGLDRVGGWFPNEPAASALFDVRPRTDEITMIKSLAPSVTLDEAAITAADYFLRVDHV